MSEVKSVRISIAGLGEAASHIHIPALAGIPGAEVVGGFDPTPAGRDFGFPRYDSLERMLADSAPDILVVAAPTTAHYELCLAGLETGAHIFCEKPFMSNVGEAHAVIERARRAGRQVVVNNQYRFMNIHSAAQRAIGGEEFGELQFLSAQHTFRVSTATEAGWRGNDPQRTCKEFGIHVLDLCRFFFGENPRSIRARMPRGARPDGPDLLNLLLLEFSGDRVAHVTLDRLAQGRHDYLDIRLDGEHGAIETHVGGNIRFSTGIRGGSRRPFFEADVSMGGRARLYRGERYRTLATDPLNLFAHATKQLMINFLDALASGATPACHAEDNIHSLALMYAAYESAEKGEAVVLDP